MIIAFMLYSSENKSRMLSITDYKISALCPSIEHVTLPDIVMIYGRIILLIPAFALSFTPQTEKYLTYKLILLPRVIGEQ